MDRSSDAATFVEGRDWWTSARYGVDPARIKQAVTASTGAVVPVRLNGSPVLPEVFDMLPVTIAAKWRFDVWYDALLPE